MLVVTVFGQPTDHISVRPIYLECVKMFVINVILIQALVDLIKIYDLGTDIDGHLVDMDPLLNAELRN